MAAPDNTIPAEINLDNTTFMLNHIGNTSNLDNSIAYTKEQKKIIDYNNSKLYQRIQHNENFDSPQPGYNAIQNLHPLGINMVANHSDRGFDYRDFPKD